MSIRGRKPAEQGVSRNRHAPKHQWTDVEDIPFTGAPKLPSRRSNGKSWSSTLMQLWAAWSSMPHCRLWSPADWQFAITTLEVAARFEDNGTAAWGAELRYRERVLGTTYDARLGMRIRYVEPAAPEPVSAIRDISEFRNL